MTKKLYYKDPLQAAWMHREFDVWYEEYFTNEKKITTAPNDIKYHEWMDSEHKWWILLESHPIFEPQAGDLVSWTLYKGQKVHEQTFYDSAYPSLIEALSSDDDALSEVKIIQRNNKAFFMPEVE